MLLYPGPQLVRCEGVARPHPRVSGSMACWFRTWNTYEIHANCLSVVLPVLWVRPCTCRSKDCCVVDHVPGPYLEPSHITAYLNIIHLMHLNVGLPNPLENSWELWSLRKKVLSAAWVHLRNRSSLSSQLSCCTSGTSCAWTTAGTAHSGVYVWLPSSPSWGSLRCFFVPRQPQTLPYHSNTSRLTLINTCCSSLCCIPRQTSLASAPAALRCQSPPSPSLCCAPFKLCKPCRTACLRGLQSSTSPLFAYFTRPGTCLDLTDFVKLWQVTLSKAGIPPQDYSGHFFRRGGCSLAFQLGMPPLLLKLHGDWLLSIKFLS